MIWGWWPELAQRVNVMYGGYIVEQAAVDDLYANPQHPYTMGLLGSLPRLDIEQHQKLASIDGLPPVLYEKPTCCPFAPRCAYRDGSMFAGKPARCNLLGLHHYAACWVDPATGKERA